MANVRVIPSTINPITQVEIGSNAKKKVAAYARVSTDSDEQYSSYETQVNYYKKYIGDNAEWEYVNVYADEGITGTNTKKRDSFNKMIEDALAGKIDLIITKSISRFARNTLDTISITRQLKDKGVEVYFEKENLWTLDSKSELILTIMASIAQEESRSISQNITIGKRWGMQEGRVSFAYSSFLGYKKENDQIVIDEEQAYWVKQIYTMFLVDGKTASGIAAYLNEKGVDTPTGKKKKWTKNNIVSILTNEKYKGDALLQKTFTKNYLDHKTVKNKGEIPQYYVENSHPAIIDKEMWEMVQAEIARRNAIGPSYSSTSIFGSKLICEDCGGFYGQKKWHSTASYAKFIYQCNKKFYKNKPKCQTPNLSEEDIKSKFLIVYNNFAVDKAQLIMDTEEVIEMITNTAELDAELSSAISEMEIVSGLVQQHIENNANQALKRSDYDAKYNALAIRYQEAKNKYDELSSKIAEKKNKGLLLKGFLNNLKEQKDTITEWDDSLWNMMVEKAVVHRDGRITFIFYNGTEITE